jgi:hypothetical protein
MVPGPRYLRELEVESYEIGLLIPIQGELYRNRVMRYRRIIKNGIDLDSHAIVLVPFENALENVRDELVSRGVVGGYFVRDGHHRVEAYILEGKKEIPAVKPELCGCDEWIGSKGIFTSFDDMKFVKSGRILDFYRSYQTWWHPTNSWPIGLLGHV